MYMYIVAVVVHVASFLPKIYIWCKGRELFTHTCTELRIHVVLSVFDVLFYMHMLYFVKRQTWRCLRIISMVGTATDSPPRSSLAAGRIAYVCSPRPSRTL